MRPRSEPISVSNAVAICGIGCVCGAEAVAALGGTWAASMAAISSSVSRDIACGLSSDSESRWSRPRALLVVPAGGAAPGSTDLFAFVFWPRCGLFAFILVKRMMLVWSQPWDISERAPVAHHSWARDENSGGHPTATLFFGEGSFSVVVGSAFKIGIGSESWKIGVGSGSSREWKLERRREWHTDA